MVGLEKEVPVLSTSLPAWERGGVRAGAVQFGHRCSREITPRGAGAQPAVAGIPNPSPAKWALCPVLKWGQELVSSLTRDVTSPCSGT